jgi:hypothetical protein
MIATLLKDLFRTRLGLLILMGLGIMALGVGFTLWSQSDANRFSAQAQGRVTRLWDMGSYRGRSYYARFQYWGNGLPETLVAEQQIKRELYAELKIGTSVTVYYVPQHPEQARIQQHPTRLEELGLLSLVVGLVILLSLPVLMSGKGVR